MNESVCENCSLHLEEIKELKEKYEEKILNLKNRIQELQKQILKTQQISYKNEFNYKHNQIETLEALKKCKLDNDSFKERIVDLEEKVKNVLILNTENFELKTAFNRSQNDLKIIKLECENTKKKSIEFETIKLQDDENYALQLAISQQKVKDLIQENQILVETIDKLNKFENHSKSNECEKCNKNDQQLMEIHDQFKMVELDAVKIKNEKSKIENDYLIQIDIMKKFEEEQCKLREEINKLNKLKCTFDSTLKSKSNEVENLSCQLESYKQRLDIREQRVNELMHQLTLKTSEDDNLKLSLSKLTEKFNHIQSETNQYEKQLSQFTAENQMLSSNQFNLEASVKEKSDLIYHLKGKLNEMTTLNHELSQSLQVHKSSSDIKIQEYNNNNVQMKDKIEELNYSINIYEKQNRSLEDEIKTMKLLIEDLQIKEKNSCENVKLTIERYETNIGKCNEYIDKYKSDIIENNCKINSLKHGKKELKQIINDKIAEIESISAKEKHLNEELHDCKEKLSDYQIKLKTLEQNKDDNESLKQECKNKSKNISKLNKIITESSAQIESFQEIIHKEKEKYLILEKEWSKSNINLEKIKVKVNCTQDELDHKSRSFDQMVDKHQLEVEKMIEKLSLVESDRDSYCSKLRQCEEINIRIDNEMKRNKEELESVKGIILMKNEELLQLEKNKKLAEAKIVNLQEHLKNSQMNVIERSREIDRLEQLVRDRSEQIEQRSSQLETFEKDLQNKLFECQQRISQSKTDEQVYNSHLEKFKVQNEELTNLLFISNEKVTEFLDIIKRKDVEFNLVKNQNEKTELENRNLCDQMTKLKHDLISKTALVKDLLEKVDKKNKEFEHITDEIESKKSSVDAKVWHIRKIESQLKKDKQNYTETEAKLRAEIKIIQNQLETCTKEKKIEIECAIKKLSSKLQVFKDKLRLSRENVEKVQNNLDDMGIKLYEKEEHIAELKIQLNTQSAVMIDMENNGRLKEMVIGRLFEKINNLSLANHNCDIDVESTTNTNNIWFENKFPTCSSVEDINLQDLLSRINGKLNGETRYKDNK